jgi:hypothetical protein
MPFDYFRNHEIQENFLLLNLHSRHILLWWLHPVCTESYIPDIVCSDGYICSTHRNLHSRHILLWWLHLQYAQKLTFQTYSALVVTSAVRTETYIPDIFCSDGYICSTHTNLHSKHILLWWLHLQYAQKLTFQTYSALMVTSAVRTQTWGKASVTVRTYAVLATYKPVWTDRNNKHTATTSPFLSLQYLSTYVRRHQSLLT